MLFETQISTWHQKRLIKKQDKCMKFMNYGILIQVTNNIQPKVYVIIPRTLH